MMLPLKPICEKKDIRRNGTSIIYIQYCYSASKRTLLNTEIAIPPHHWNKKSLAISKELPSIFGDYKILNQELKRIIRLVEDIIDFAVNKEIIDIGHFVKKTFKPHFQIDQLKDEKIAQKIIEEKKITERPKFFPQIEDYINSKTKKVSPDTIGVFNQMKEHLASFEMYRKKEITFECIDYNFYDCFTHFLAYDYIHKRRIETKKGLKVNTIGKTVKQFRLFIKDRARRKIIPPIDLTDFKIMEEETDAIYLTESEIEAIKKLDLSRFPDLNDYRNLFVVACLTGLRFSDFSILKPEDLRGKYLYKKQEKSEHWVVIPLRDVAHNIISTYLKTGVPKISNPEFNYYIKEIGKLAGIDIPITFSYKKGNKTIVETKPKYAWITSHTCRRSFCTNEFLSGTPVLLIMKISGHKKEKDFYKYIRISAEEAAIKIEKIWKERQSFC